jgi:hypothetical protein
MTEDFVDYVKIYVSSEREEKDLHIYRKIYCEKVPGRWWSEDMFICRNKGLAFTLRHIKASNGGEMEVETKY